MCGQLSLNSSLCTKGTKSHAHQPSACSACGSNSSHTDAPHRSHFYLVNYSGDKLILHDNSPTNKVEHLIVRIYGALILGQVSVSVFLMSLYGIRTRLLSPFASLAFDCSCIRIFDRTVLSSRWLATACFVLHVPCSFGLFGRRAP